MAEWNSNNWHATYYEKAKEMFCVKSGKNCDLDEAGQMLEKVVRTL